MNERNIERIMDVLQYAVDHYGQTFMEDDVYIACPKATSNIIDLLDDLGVVTCTKDRISFDESNVEEYRSFLSGLEDEIDDLNISVEEKNKLISKIDIHLNLNANILNVDAGL